MPPQPGPVVLLTAACTSRRSVTGQLPVQSDQFALA
eukprot:SAG11_NODE_6899_length_1229_cov_1.665487_1_plen_35_part_10